jgi:hypothetical protein
MGAKMKSTESALVRFRLRQKSVHADFMTRVFLLMGLVIGLPALPVWLLSDSGLDWITILLIIAIPAVGIWGWRRMSIGEAVLSETGLRVRSRTQTQTYPWEDIVSVGSDTAQRAYSGDNRAVFRALGVNLTNHQVVVVELKRSVREHPLLNRLGTRTLGIPYGTTIFIEPEDVDGFIEAANRLLIASRS